ncbi:MAG: N-acetylmuramoyl-L-alanine amidase [Lawsonibacter sp.]|nr:N-acetylmuramoyl-L-alanine amidase [Lawsonibacter sp.]
MRRGVMLLGSLILTSVCMMLTLQWFYAQSTPAVAPMISSRADTLILDAGHGGEDGGAVSITGVPESQINLAIVLKMDDILGFYGTSPILLRTEDISLHDSTAETLREKKVSDLKNRVAAIQAAKDATLISIHQNSYPDGRYHGAQVFYAPTEGSMELAQHIQNALKTSLQPDNNRERKQIPNTVYLMNHITCRAVMVECGFLTNSEEEAKIRDDGYQRKLAALLSFAWLTSCDQISQAKEGAL